MRNLSTDSPTPTNDQVSSTSEATAEVLVPPPYPQAPNFYNEGKLEVKAEEALIVILVLVLWVGAIVLFFNRWGKIRMLEPYQPKFHQEHRPSCHVSEINTQRMSFSKYNVSLETPLLGPMPSSYRSLLRPRQNSVFVGSVVKMNPPRKTKSAVDLQSLVANETSPAVSRSFLPTLSVERRPSSCVFPMTSGATLAGPVSAVPSTSAGAVGVAGPSTSGAAGPGRRPSSAGFLSPRRPSIVHLTDLLPPGAFTGSRDRRPSFNNVIAQVTAERRPSSSMLRIVNV